MEKTNWKEELKLGDGFYKSKNYSNAYFCYYRSLKLKVKEYLKKVSENKNFDEEEALEFAATKEMFGLTPDILKELKEKFEEFINRKKINKESCDKVKKIINNVKI